MAKYCTVDEVKSVFKKVIGVTAITDQDIDDWIGEESDVIDGYLAYEYNLPLKGKRSLNICKAITRFLTGSRVYMAIMRSASTPYEEGSLGYDTELMNRGKELYNDLRTGKLLLDETDLRESVILTPYIKGFNDKNKMTTENRFHLDKKEN